MAKTLYDFINEKMSLCEKLSKHDLVVSFYQEVKKKDPTLSDFDRYDRLIEKNITKMQSNGIPVRLVGDNILSIGSNDIASSVLSKKSHDFADSIGDKILKTLGFQKVPNQKKARDGGIDFIGYKIIDTFSTSMPTSKIVIAGQVKQYSDSKKKATVEEIRQFQGAIDASYLLNNYSDICNCDFLVKLFVAPEGFTSDALETAKALKIYPLTALDLQNNFIN